MLTVVPEDGSVEGGSSSLIDEIVRDGARRMLASPVVRQTLVLIGAVVAGR